MNLNKIARSIALREGGKVNLSIAQVKEVMRLTLLELSKFNYVDVMMIWQRYRRLLAKQRKRKP